LAAAEVRERPHSPGLILKVIKAIFGISGLCLWFWSFHLWNNYFKHGPHMLQPETGNTCRLENHGDIVYVTLTDCHLLEAARIVATIFFYYLRTALLDRAEKQEIVLGKSASLAFIARACHSRA
jgi:hypothetical protein